MKMHRACRPLKDSEKLAQFVDGNSQVSFPLEVPVLERVFYSNKKKEDGSETDFQGVTLFFRNAKQRITTSADRIYAAASDALKPLVAKGEELILDVKIGYNKGIIFVGAK